VPSRGRGPDLDALPELTRPRVGPRFLARPHSTGHRLRTALDRAGYGWVTSHAFRKTAATVLDQSGLSARAIAGHIGHARPSITQDVYMDKRSAGREAAQALDAAWGSGSSDESVQ
jgi:integrase